MATYYFDLDATADGDGSEGSPANDPSRVESGQDLAPSTGDTYYIKSAGNQPWNCGFYFGDVNGIENVSVLAWPGETDYKLYGHLDPSNLTTIPVWQDSTDRGDSHTNVFSIDVSECFIGYENLTVPRTGVLKAVRRGYVADAPDFTVDPPTYTEPTDWAIEESFDTDLNTTLTNLNAQTEAYYYFDDTNADGSANAETLYVRSTTGDDPNTGSEPQWFPIIVATDTERSIGVHIENAVGWTLDKAIIVNKIQDACKGIQFNDSRNCTITNCKVHWIGQDTGTTEAIALIGGECENNTVSDCEVIGTLQGDNAYIASASNASESVTVTFTNCHYLEADATGTDGSTVLWASDGATYRVEATGSATIGLVTFKTCTAWSKANGHHLFAISTGFDAPATIKDPITYPVRFQDCRIYNMRAETGAFAFERCAFEHTGSNTNNEEWYEHWSNHIYWLFESCVLLFYEIRTNVFRMWGANHRIILNNSVCWLNDESGQHAWFGCQNVSGPADLRVNNTIFRNDGEATNGFLFSARNANSAPGSNSCALTNLDGIGGDIYLWTHGITNWRTSDDPTGTELADFQANHGTNGVYEVSPDVTNSSPTEWEDLEGTSGGNMRTTFGNIDNSPIGINDGAYENLYGAWQYFVVSDDTEGNAVTRSFFGQNISILYEPTTGNNRFRFANASNFTTLSDRHIVMSGTKINLYEDVSGNRAIAAYEITLDNSTFPGETLSSDYYVYKGHKFSFYETGEHNVVHANFSEGGDSGSSITVDRNVIIHGEPIALTADNFIVIKKVPSIDSVTEIRKAYLGGVPVSVALVSGIWCLCIKDT